MNKRWLIGTLFLLLGCVFVRKHTYPPDFVYLEKQKLSTTMWKFAISLATINSDLKGIEIPKDAQQAEVVKELKNLEALARTMGGGGKHSNHPMIDDHLDDFIRDIEMARMAADRNPPNYYYAGKLAGSCLHCHGNLPILQSSAK